MTFLLCYLKVYPTFDVLGAQFGMYRSKACDNVHALLPSLYRAGDNLGVLPAREFKTVEEFRAACNWIDEILINATERPHCRHQDNEKQNDLYSGKKRHTIMTTIIATGPKGLYSLVSLFRVTNTITTC